MTRERMQKSETITAIDFNERVKRVLHGKETPQEELKRKATEPRVSRWKK